MAIKQSRGVTSGKGTPTRREGQNGDITIRRTNEGRKLFVKDVNNWHPFSSDNGINIENLIDNINLRLKLIESNRHKNVKTLKNLTIKTSGGTDTYNPQIAFNIGGTDKFTIGVDDSVSGDPLIVASGGALGTNDRMSLDSSGNLGIGGTNLKIDYDGTGVLLKNNSGVLNIRNLADDANANIALGTVTSGAWDGDAISSSKGGISITNNTNNYVITGTGTIGTINGEANLTFDGTTLTTTDFQCDYVNIGASTLTITDSSDANDLFGIITSTHGATTIRTIDNAATAADLLFDIHGDITLDSHTGVFIAKAAGTEFSAANSAYAGMILGYTKIMNDSTTIGHATITIDSSDMTVMETAQGTDLSIQFKVPPSGNVEIECSFWMTGVSKGAKFALSSTDVATGFTELDETYTYDADQVVYIDESDHSISTIKFALSGLTNVGDSKTYYLAGLASGSSTYISHGRNRGTGTHYPPIILKATALPATIVTGE